MNYLWEILLQAQEQGIEAGRLRFVAAGRYSPYAELAEEYINLAYLEEPYTIEINPCYRFLPVFKDMFHPEVRDYPALREGLFRLLVHQLGENDVRMGMTREEYYKKLLGEALLAGAYGEEGAEAWPFFAGGERDLLLEAILTLYREGESLALFRHVMCAVLPNCIVYGSNRDPYEILVYIGQKKSEALERKADFLLHLFLGIRYQAELYYEYHFGIIGMEDAMHIGEIAIC